MAKKESDPHHQHKLISADFIETREGAALLVRAIAGDQESRDCVDRTMRNNGFEHIEEVSKPRSRYQVGFAGGPWSATWEPTGPTNPNYRRPPKNARAN